MAYKPIEDYGVIGDGKTLALVACDGSIDWMCLPHVDSPSVFAAILDSERGGCFSVQPAREFDSVQSYLRGTNILQTRFRTSEGELELTDFFPFGAAVAGMAEQSHPVVLRRLRCLAGAVTARVTCMPRFDYGRDVPRNSLTGNSVCCWQGDNHVLQVACTGAIEWENDSGRLSLQREDTVWLAASQRLDVAADAELFERALEATEKRWRKWLRPQHMLRYGAGGFWRRHLDRTALVLKLLQFEPTGAMVAAATSSLPAIIHGRRNWDYRYSWARDSSLTMRVLFELGHATETWRYLQWLREIIAREDSIATLHCIEVPTPPGGEVELDHLSGYKDSRPVLIGQAASSQVQHDIYGELLQMVFEANNFTNRVQDEDWNSIRSLVDRAVSAWSEKDSGIWELRNGPHHVTHSKLMCWVAIDRGIRIAEYNGFAADLDKWKRERAAVRRDLLANGYDDRLRHFVQHYDSEAIDAALLQIPLVGFLPVTDHRVVGTIRAVERELLVDGVVLRYRGDDGLPGQEHGFMICLFWYVRCLIMQGRLDEAEMHLRRASCFSNPLNLFSEQYDPVFRQMTGNFPQALSHLGYASAVIDLLDARGEQ